MSNSLKEWKVVITSVGQGYKSTKGHHDYKISTRVTYSRQGQPIDIGRSNENFKDEKLKCFNYNKYEHMAKKCWAKKKEWEIRKCFKYNKKGYIARDCKEKQTIKKRKVQEESDNKDEKKEEDFGKDLE